MALDGVHQGQADSQSLVRGDDVEGPGRTDQRDHDQYPRPRVDRCATEQVVEQREQDEYRGRLNDGGQDGEQDEQAEVAAAAADRTDPGEHQRASGVECVLVWWASHSAA